MISQWYYSGLMEAQVTLKTRRNQVLLETEASP